MNGPAAAGEDLGLQPLTARSVLLSVLLGSHPPELPVRALVRTGALFGIPDGTIRVALSRMAAEGDVDADAGRYRLAGRLLVRQRRQDEGRAAATLEWDGSWEVVVAAPSAGRAGGGRAAPSRTATRAELAELAGVLATLRLAEWRDGVWARPANLARTLPPDLPGGARLLCSASLADPAGLAAALWDLDGWARRARNLEEAMGGRPDPALQFTISAAAVAHLRDDPLLPPELLPAGWPGAALRQRYSAFEDELAALLRRAGEP